MPGAGALYYPLNWHNILFTSNGLASGNTFEEAIVQGLCELVERENVYRLFVERRVAREIDPDRAWHDILEELKLDHPSGDDLRTRYDSEMQRARDFVRENDLVTIPENETLEETLAELEAWIGEVEAGGGRE